MPGLSELFLDYVLPAIIVGALLAIGWASRGTRRDGRWAGGIAIAGGFAAALAAIAGVPARAPWNADAAAWLFWFSVPVAVLALLDALLRPPTWLRAVIMLIVGRLGFRALITPVVMHSDPDAAAAALLLETWVDAISGIAVLWWLAIEAAADRMQGPIAPAVFAIVAAGATAVFALSANVQATQAMTALAGMMIVGAIAGWPIRHLSFARGAALAFVIPMIGEMTFVHFYSYTPPPLAACCLLLIAPLLCWSGDLPGVRGWRRGRLIARLAPVLIATALAALITARAPSSAAHSAGHSRSDPAED